jgi:ABC-type branched-subunit amino acid transport system ATPase component
MAFGGVRALDDVDISLAEGTRLGLIGPNGSGKTTLLNVLSGVYRATSGSILVDGREIVGAGPGKRARMSIVRTFQHPQLAPSLTIRENVALGARLATRKSARPFHDSSTREVDAALEMFHCAEYSDRLPNEVPYGIRKMAEVARAAAAGPRLLLLDEPAAGLSGEERVELVSALAGFTDTHPTTSMCLVEHDVPLVAQLCPELLVLSAGRTLNRGDTESVLRDPMVRDAYLGTSQNNSSTARVVERSTVRTEKVDARA